MDSIYEIHFAVESVGAWVKFAESQHEDYARTICEMLHKAGHRVRLSKTSKEWVALQEWKEDSLENNESNHGEADSPKSTTTK